MATLKANLKKGTEYVVPSALSAGILAGALVEIFPYFIDKPNATIVLALGLYVFMNYGLIFIRKYTDKWA